MESERGDGMNHDYCHCLDFTEKCPKECFRAQLERDLRARTDLFGVPLTYGHFGGTSLCLHRMPRREVKE